MPHSFVANVVAPWCSSSFDSLNLVQTLSSDCHGLPPSMWHWNDSFNIIDLKNTKNTIHHSHVSIHLRTLEWPSWYYKGFNAKLINAKTHLYLYDSLQIFHLEHQHNTNNNNNTSALYWTHHSDNLSSQDVQHGKLNWIMGFNVSSTIVCLLQLNHGGSLPCRDLNHLQ